MSISSSRGVRSHPVDPVRVLEEIKRLVLERLNGIPGEFYGPVESALSSLVLGGDSALSPQLLYQSQAALWVLRQHHAAHVMAYRQHVAQGFEGFRSLTGRDGGDLPLGLIDETQIDSHLAGQALATSLEQRHAVPLETLAARLTILATRLGVEPAMNPLGPTRLAMAFVDTFRDEQVPAVLRGLLFEHYEQALEAVLPELYERANAVLSEGGYGFPPSRNRALPAAPASPQSRDSGAGSGSYGDAVADRGDGYDHGGAGSGGGHRRGHDMDWHAGTHAQDSAQGSWGTAPDAPTPAELHELRGLLRAWREGGQGDASTPSQPQPRSMAAGGRRELRLDELVSLASMMQAEPADVFARALAGSGSLAGAIREQLNHGSRRLGMDPEQIRFSAEDEDAIDLVGLLFDSLFRSQHLQDRARRMYARLVLPFVKVALTDQRLFVSPQHPARQLFDAITEAVAGNTGETVQERELLDRAASISQRVVAEYNEDLVIFETAHRELDALLQQQRRRIELQEERAAKATNGRERLAHAREQADTVLARRLSAPPLSPAIAEFLRSSWRHHLVQTWLREGGESERLSQAISLGDALVEADRIAADGRGNELADHLLALEPRIAECLASSGLDQDAAEHGLAVLVRGLVYPNTPRDLHPPPPRQVEDDAEERSQWLEAEASRVPDAALVERMGKLEAGEWLQMTDLDGASIAAKIAWISPLTGRRLIVNRRGLRVLVASPAELAFLAVAGRLQTGCEPTAFEQAMREVREQLDRAAATPLTR